ncbi:unnamed protein product [Thlaspi arvense]|uniref:Uncharacterized protein n=1 Tax=Thlaspi arvense TaxID=13288 RepID=A0AAU9S0T5_THLAR|nr:unnamed protein product [Thlaspi arvense]
MHFSSPTFELPFLPLITPRSCRLWQPRQSRSDNDDVVVQMMEREVKIITGLITFFKKKS